MVKPLVMGIIGGMIGAIAIIGGLFAFLAYQNAEYQRFNEDYLIASSYQSAIDDFLFATCLPFSMPTSIADAVVQLEYSKRNHQLRQEHKDTLVLIRQQIENIQQKYSGTDYYNKFNFQDYECPMGDLSEAIAFQLGETPTVDEIYAIVEERKKSYDAMLLNCNVIKKSQDESSYWKCRNLAYTNTDSAQKFLDEYLAKQNP